MNNATGNRRDQAQTEVSAFTSVSKKKGRGGRTRKKGRV